MRAAISTFGCKQNQYESVGMAEILAAEGYDIVPFDEPADLYLVNTCTVTGSADQQARREIRGIHRRAPDARVVVTGCYAQRAPGDIAGIPGVSLVLGNHEKSRLGGYLRALPQRESRVEVGNIAAIREFDDLPVTHFTGHARGFLKIQDGCNLKCTYCVIPSVRGRSRSLPPERVVEATRRMADAGHPEIVLTGIHIGHYGNDLRPAASLPDLLARMLEVPGIANIRLSSMEPSEFSPGLLDFIAAEPRVCRHFHIPFQSGSTRILRAMRRPYEQSHTISLLDRLFGALPEVGVGGDMIVGFPGETDADFAESMELLRRYPLSYLHVFGYSERAGTPAASADGKVPPLVIRDRVKAMRELASARALEFRTPYLGREVPVLVLAERAASGLVEAITGNYLRIRLEAPDEKLGTYQRARVLEAGEQFCAGMLV